MTMTEAQVMSLKDVVVKPKRGRQHFDAKKMMELMESVKKYGVIQPIVVTTELIGGVEKVVLVAGERRVRASLMAGKSTIPFVWKKDLDPKTQTELELEENVGREDLTWEERNELLRRIVEFETAARGTKRGDPNAFKMAELEAKTGEDETTISQRVKFAQDLKANPEMAKEILGKGLNETAAKAKFKALVQTKKTQEDAAAGRIKLYTDYKNGDSRELVKTISSGTVDCICTDSPFAIPELADADAGDQIYKQAMVHSDNLTTDEMKELMRALVPEWFRIMKPGAYGYIFFGWDCYGDIISFLRTSGFEVDVEPIIWDKKMTTSSWKGYSPAPCYEQILQFIKPPKERRQNEPWKRIIECSPVSRSLRTHPFEKPVPLLGKLIGNCTKQGDVVYDPFAGTFSTGIACMELKRTVIAHELNPQHYFLGQKRQAEFQLKQAQAVVTGGK